MTLSPHNLFFTGDTHFGHTNIIKYCNRPFKDAKEMDNELVTRWNRVVPAKGATVIHLGDVFLCPRARAESLLEQLNGTIYWIPGNHDKVAWSINTVTSFVRCSPLTELYVNHRGKDQMIVCCHYALRTWSRAHHGSWHLYGHSHGGLKDDMGKLMEDNPYTLSMDVGVDCNNFQPFSFQDIKAVMSKRQFRAVDHHSAKMSAVSGPDPEKVSYG